MSATILVTGGTGTAAGTGTAPGQAARAVRAGANLAPDRAVGHRTWEDFSTERVGSS